MNPIPTTDCISIAGGRYLLVDSSVDCDSLSYRQFRAPMVVFLVIYQAVPVVWFLLIWRDRKKINPPTALKRLLDARAHPADPSNKNKSTASAKAWSVEERAADDRLLHLQFLWKVRRPCNLERPPPPPPPSSHSISTSGNRALLALLMS